MFVGYVIAFIGGLVLAVSILGILNDADTGLAAATGAILVALGLILNALQRLIEIQEARDVRADAARWADPGP